jgi:hypothetical protein
MSSTTSSNIPVNETIRTQSAESDTYKLSGTLLGKYYMRIAIGKYQRPRPFGSPKLNPRFYIFLPLPKSLADVTSVGYSDQNLETIGDYMNAATGASGKVQAALLRQSGNLISAVGDFGAKAAGVAAKNTGGMAGAGAALGINALASGMDRIFNTDAMTSAVQQEAGVAPNPNPSVAFTGPILRTVNYDWSLYPTNRNESLAIQKLIRLLKRSALPRSAIGGSAAILSYPDICQLNFYPWDNQGTGEWGWRNATDSSAGSIIKFKKCVMQNVSVSYAAGGAAMAFFEGTNLPTSYELSIEFKEIEYMLSDNWSDTTLPPGFKSAEPNIETQLRSVSAGVGQGATQIGLRGALASAEVAAGIFTGSTAGVAADTFIGAGGGQGRGLVL